MSSSVFWLKPCGARERPTRWKTVNEAKIAVTIDSATSQVLYVPIIV